VQSGHVSRAVNQDIVALARGLFYCAIG